MTRPKPHSLDYAPRPTAASPTRLAVRCALLTCALFPVIASIRFHLRHSPMVIAVAIVGIPFLLACATAGILTVPPGQRRRTLRWFAAPIAAAVSTMIYLAVIGLVA